LKLTAFSWGFWGWGTATTKLVAAIDAVERKRGFNPPVFVDIRYQRSGRAPEFQGNEFEERVGWRRYRWMKGLGNSSIGTRKRMTLAFEPAVASLLDLIRDAHTRSSRVIFFCACRSPEDAAKCHRHLVTKLLGREARARLIDLDVQEWPGGDPRPHPLELRVSLADLKAVARGAQSVPLGTSRIRPELAALAWGTLMRLRAGKEEILVAVGPAAYRRGSWCLPLFMAARAGSSEAFELTKLKRSVSRLRRTYGLA